MWDGLSARLFDLSRIMNSVIDNAIFKILSLLISVIVLKWLADLVTRLVKRRHHMERYVGIYFGYRLSKSAGVVEPEIEIKRDILFRYSIMWKRPGRDEAVSLKIIDHMNREIYALGFHKPDRTRLFVILHKNQLDLINMLVGVYCFIDSANRVVSGNFLMSRRKLTARQAEIVWPLSVCMSDNTDASNAYQANNGKLEGGSRAQLNSWRTATSGDRGDDRGQPQAVGDRGGFAGGAANGGSIIWGMTLLADDRSKGLGRIEASALRVLGSSADAGKPWIGSKRRASGGSISLDPHKEQIVWTQVQKDIAWSYEGTCESIAVIAGRLDLTEAQAEDLMLEVNLEQCGECGWWCECGELLDEADEPAPCMSCRGIH